ncbi:hypothetical protein [Micromonospora sp. RP3T]|uniref:hypothetical protein n=1 Tax=Micromonospora sp. RP3T TaxID=2135446 RepID=UPI003D764712
MTTTRPFPVFGLFVAAVSAISLSGCGGSADTGNARVATAQKPAQTATATPRQPTETAAGATKGASSAPGRASAYDKALSYTRCMNENGVRLPDPVEGKPLPVGSTKGATAILSTDGTRGWIKISPEAFAACKSFLPEAWPVKFDAAELTRERPFRECMRRQGIDMPEPVLDARGMVNDNPDRSDHDAPEYRAAEEACRGTLDDPAVKAGK